MKYSVLFATAAALALGGCQKSETAAETPASENAAVTAVPAANAGAAAPTASAGAAPTKEFMVGIWSDGEGCKMPINFQADGTIKDGPFAKWDLKDGYLTMEGAPQKMKLEVVDEKTMKSQIEGSTETNLITRC